MLKVAETAKADVPLPAAARAAELQFVAEPSELGSWIAAIRRLLADGHRRIGARLFDEAALEFADKMAAEFGPAFIVLEADAHIAPPDVKLKPSEAVDAVLLIGGAAERASAALLDYVDNSGLTVVAPVTDRYWQKLPLYLISIPKAGTHLLFRLAEALGYVAGGLRTQQPVGGHWYYLLNSNAHTSASEFFCDELQKAPFGNRAHPFMRSPALFNYRNPLDILVSEANYWHIDGNSPLSVLLSPLSFEERVDRLIDNRWLLGTIRDRVGSFAAWLDCANVIPVSFEEMVGGAGGGSNEALEKLIWSLQLKLHVPGKPAEIRLAVSGRASPTFREGRINSWRKQLTPAALKRFEALPQDFMETYGYDTGAGADSFTLPKHAEAYRHRPLRVMTASHFKVPFLVETDFLGHNIVSFMDRYYAVEMTVGDLDLTQFSSAQLEKLINAHNLPSLRARIAIRQIENELEPRIGALINTLVNERLAELEAERNRQAAARAAAAAELVRADERVGPVQPIGRYLRYNLFRRRDGVLAVPIQIGAVDPNVYDLRWNRDVIASSAAVTARLRVLWAWIRWAYWDGAKI